MTWRVVRLHQLPGVSVAGWEYGLRENRDGAYVGLNESTVEDGLEYKVARELALELAAVAEVMGS